MARLRWKESPDVVTRPISNLILNEDLYDVDKTYQRPPGVWTTDMEGYLLDSILRGYSVPPIIVHKKGDKRFIVDGQQRWNAIMKFAKAKLEISKKYSSDIIEENDGKTKFGDLHEEWRDRFNSYPMTLYYLEDYSDEEIRSTFLRLQESKTLTPGEKLNAHPGDIVLAMRKLGEHKFFRESIRLHIRRYKNYKLAGTFLFLEGEGIKSISPKYLYEFFKDNRDLSEGSQEYKNVKRTLNYLIRAFPSRTPELRTEAWIVSTYILTSTLLKDYAVGDNPDNLGEFVVDFSSMIDKAKVGSDKELLDFREAVSRGTNNERTIRLRHEIILSRFVETYDPPRLDENRLFSDKQRRNIFRRDDSRCQVCGKKLEFGDENTHYHHKTMYRLGGPTTEENGVLVCKDCHYKKLHGKKEE